MTNIYADGEQKALVETQAGSAVVYASFGVPKV
jgi:hypothetical protein